MKRSNRMTAGLLCALLALTPVVSSCGDAPETPKDNTQKPDGSPNTPVTEAVTEDPAAKILDAIPDDTNFEGREIRIRVNEFDQTQYGAEVFVKGPDEADGDIVHDAILARNQAVEDRLNVKFNYEIVSYAWDQIYSNTQKLIMSGEDVYDLIIDQQYGLLKIAANNLFYNVYDAGVNDFSQNYWWDPFMDQMQVGTDARYILAGDYFLDIVEVASGIFFNKAMYEENYESCDDLYQAVIDGKWTIDMLGTYIKEFYSDVNGDGKPNDGDIFSMNLSRNFMDATVFGSGIDFMTRDKDGMPVLNMEDERVSTMWSSVHASYLEPKTTFNFGTVAGVTEAEYYQNQRKAFAARNLLFLNDYLAACKDLRDMKDDYGILPIPKMDEAVPAYRTITHDTAAEGGIPITCGSPEIVLTVLEALCSMSHNTSMQTYFEQAMKVKYARDEKTTAMIDIMHNSITTSFAYAQGAQLSNVYEIFRTMFDNKSSDFASTYAKQKKSVDKMLAKLIDKYNENK
ncbi:MAG: hypothetical protein MJ175_10405 [Clostridia bacterium]|nr:hypothetical protein [Clostridia bacterium]